MCIRDRARGIKKGIVQGEARGMAKGISQGIEEINTLYPVSYTHLDVYKRQNQSGANCEHKRLGKGTSSSGIWKTYWATGNW